jgi:hypothetical protein
VFDEKITSSPLIRLAKNKGTRVCRRYFFCICNCLAINNLCKNLIKAAENKQDALL